MVHFEVLEVFVGTTLCTPRLGAGYDITLVCIRIRGCNLLLESNALGRNFSSILELSSSYSLCSKGVMK